MTEKHGIEQQDYDSYMRSSTQQKQKLIKRRVLRRAYLRRIWRWVTSALKRGQL